MNIKYERIWWRFFQKRVVQCAMYNKLSIYVFLYIYCICRWHNHDTQFIFKTSCDVNTLIHDTYLGNDNIHLITSNGDHELSVYMEDFKGHHSYANYTHFLVGDEVAKYVLTVNGYTGVAG